MLFSKIIFLTVILYSTSLWAGDILFINLNNGKNEIAAVKKAAQEKGDHLTVIPKPGRDFSIEEFKKEVNEKNFRSLIVSGHSGDDTFEGTSGTLKIEEVLSALDNAKSKNIETLYLMGCYTGNKSKLAIWKSALPNLKFIAGFDQEAPLSTTPASPKYLYDLMKKESLIVGSSSNQDLIALLNGINVLKIVNASLYISCDVGEYNYVSQLAPSKRLSEFAASACSEQQGEFRRVYLAEIRKYLKGDLEPTSLSTSNSVIRKAYSLARKAENCFTNDLRDILPELDPDALFQLLFSKGFNENFARYNKNLIAKVLEEVDLAQRDPQAFKKAQGEEAAIQEGKIKRVLENPDFDELVQRELKRIASAQRGLKTQNPGLENCCLWGNECHFPSSIINEYGRNWNVLRKDPEEIKAILDSLVFSPPPPPSFAPKDIVIMQKMLSRPETLTRKEMLVLQEDFDNNPNLTKNMKTLGVQLKKLTAFSPDLPFSWHEYDRGPIEAPQHTYTQFKNPELAILNETVLDDD